MTDYNLSFFTNSLLEIVTANSPDSILKLKYSFILSCILFIILSPLYKSRKSWFDAVAANKMITILRIFIFLELFNLLLLLYYTISLGSPLKLHEFTSYGKGNGSFIYGYSRPICGIILISFGTIGDMHAFARILCIIGLIIEIFGDAISAYQIEQYIKQTIQLSAPTGLYSLIDLNIYYYRDIISFGICTYLLLLKLLFTCTVGIFNPVFIPYQLIVGGDFDRCEVMRKQRTIENNYKYNLINKNNLENNVNNDNTL